MQWFSVTPRPHGLDYQSREIVARKERARHPVNQSVGLSLPSSFLDRFWHGTFRVLHKIVVPRPARMCFGHGRQSGERMLRQEVARVLVSQAGHMAGCRILE